MKRWIFTVQVNNLYTQSVWNFSRVHHLQSGILVVFVDSLHLPNTKASLRSSDIVTPVWKSCQKCYYLHYMKRPENYKYIPKAGWMQCSKPVDISIKFLLPFLQQAQHFGPRSTPTNSRNYTLLYFLLSTVVDLCFLDNNLLFAVLFSSVNAAYIIPNCFSRTLILDNEEITSIKNY